MLSVKNATRVLKKLGRSTLRTRTALKSTSTVTFAYPGSTNDKAEESNFSSTISFTSPESDFSTSHVLIKSQYTDLDYELEELQDEKVHNVGAEWSGAFSFSSPESDFTSGLSSVMQSSMNTTQQDDRNTVEAIKEAKETFFENVKHNSQRDNLAYSLSFTSAESDFSNPEFAALLNEQYKKQLSNSSLLADLPSHEDANQLSSMVNRHELEEDFSATEYQELRAHADLLSHEEALPINMEEAIAEDDNRAIVITEAQVPFRIVTVNSAWEHLCGYTKDECNGQTLQCIQGPETNQGAITALMAQLLRGEEAGTVLVNYKKDGSRFLNRLRVGALRDKSNAVTHFVGILKEVNEMKDQFNEGSKILA